MKMTSREIVLLALAASAIMGSPAANGQFDDVTNWAAFDAGEHKIGNDPDGYSDAVFDGRYVYLIPFVNSSGPHGEVLRYDTIGDFTAMSSWAAYDPDANGVGIDSVGYMGGVFDGRYVYFVPLVNGDGFHGEVLRYDTNGEFLSTISWAAYNPGDNGVGLEPAGFNGAVFDGQYIYFVPFANGEVLRYDKDGDFSDASSWATFDPGNQGVGYNPEGYRGAAFDGRFIYFAPGERGTGGIPHGEVLRFDSNGGFSDVSSWSACDPGSLGVGTDPDGYAGAVFDGRYVYFVPLHNGSTESGEVLRYDTSGAFSEFSSWVTYDAGAHGVGSEPRGYAGAIFDGRHIYFVPHYDYIAGDDEVLRYDTTGGFLDASSWTTYDPVGAGIGNGADGRLGGVFDGRHIYFAPYHDFNAHGQVLRYDTIVDCNGNDIQDECDLDCGPAGGDCDVQGCGQSEDINGTGIPDECEPPIPTISEWGLVALTLLFLTAGTILVMRMGLRLV